MTMRNLLPNSLLVAALVLTQAAFAQSYNELAPLNAAQTERLQESRVDKPVSNFGVVDSGLYRSAMPKSLNEMKSLAAMGVKTVVDLMNKQEDIDQEASWAKEAGIKHISIPLSGFWAPHDDDVARIQKLMKDPAQRPLLFHCAHGMERTGLEAALYRVFTDHWKPESAYKEMKAYGFHTVTFPMKDYFEEKTKSSL